MGKQLEWMDFVCESLKYANHILSILISICFTCMFKHCYLPIGMLNSVIVPLVKNKNGDLSDRNDQLLYLVWYLKYLKMLS